MLFITEVFCHCQTRLCNTHTGPRRFVHLTEYQSGLADNAGFFHFVPEVVPFSGTLADTRKNRVAAVFGCNISDQFLNQNGFTNTSTAEQTNLTALCIRCKQVDNLDTSFQNFNNRALIPERRSFSVDCPLLLCMHFSGVVNRFTQNIEHSAQCFFADWNLNTAASCSDFHILCQTIGCGQADAANNTVAHVLCHFHDTLFMFHLDCQSVFDHRQFAGKCNVNDRPENLYNFSGFHGFSDSSLSHDQIYFAASAPLEISVISCVIAACLARLYCNESVCSISFALVVAESIADIRACCSLQNDSTIAP